MDERGGRDKEETRKRVGGMREGIRRGGVREGRGWGGVREGRGWEG